MSRFTGLTSRLLTQLKNARSKASNYLRSPEIEDIAYQQKAGRSPFQQAAEELDPVLKQFRVRGADDVYNEYTEGLKRNARGILSDKDQIADVKASLMNRLKQLHRDYKDDLQGLEGPKSFEGKTPKELARAVHVRETRAARTVVSGKVAEVAKKYGEPLTGKQFAGKPVADGVKAVRDALVKNMDQKAGTISLPTEFTKPYNPGVLGRVMAAGTKATRPIGKIPLIGNALRQPWGYGLAAAFAPALIGAAFEGFRKATSPTGGIDAEALLAQREQMLEFQRQQAKRQALRGQIASNMLRIQQLMPHKYLELLAGRPLAQGTFMIGAPPRPELVEQLAADLATGQLTAGSSMLDMMPMRPGGTMPGGGMPVGMPGEMAGGPFAGMMR